MYQSHLLLPSIAPPCKCFSQSSLTTHYSLLYFKMILTKNHSKLIPSSPAILSGSLKLCHIVTECCSDNEAVKTQGWNYLINLGKPPEHLLSNLKILLLLSPHILKVKARTEETLSDAYNHPYFCFFTFKSNFLAIFYYLCSKYCYKVVTQENKRKILSKSTAII